MFNFSFSVKTFLNWSEIFNYQFFGFEIVCDLFYLIEVIFSKSQNFSKARDKTTEMLSKNGLKYAVKETLNKIFY